MFILTLDSNDPFFNLSAEEYFLCEKDEDFPALAERAVYCNRQKSERGGRDKR